MAFRALFPREWEPTDSLKRECDRRRMAPVAGPRVRSMRAMFAKLRDWIVRKSPIHARWTRYSFDSHTITGDGPLGRKISVRVEDICEIGIETNDAGPFQEDVFWLINRETDGLRIPHESPVFSALMDYFRSFEGFDWQPCTDAMSCTDCRFFLCWRRADESA